MTKTFVSLAVAALLAAPLAGATSAFAQTSNEQYSLATAAARGDAALSAAIQDMLRANSHRAPQAVMTEIAAALYSMGGSHTLRAQLAVQLVDAAKAMAEAGELPGMSVQQAANAAAEAALVVGQNNPTYVGALMAAASSHAAGEPSVADQNIVVQAFAAASQSSGIDPNNVPTVMTAADAYGFRSGDVPGTVTGSGVNNPGTTRGPFDHRYTGFGNYAPPPPNPEREYLSPS